MLPTLKMDNIILRMPKDSDLVSFFYFASKSEIGPNAGWFPHRNLDETKAILALHIIENNVWAITLENDDLMIGTISLHNKVSDKFFGLGAEIGFVLDNNYWNQGIVTKAVSLVLNYVFSTLKFDYVRAAHADFNIASQKVIEKSGFKFMFKKHKKYIENPKIHYVLYYEITKKEFYAHENKFRDEI
ncbi:GNAT family N-acetyltransferase [Acholeplasma granularum]|uniref:GNAT family N-acetyltransferase n=1 Tax=Acholeplasma granularum TaxID=264635 RepID=UPI000470CCF9|nr:GNAT family N-acetyltransferase [Acholeplasma granularum]